MNEKQDKPFTGYPSIDKPWLKYYGQKSPLKLDEKTVYQTLYAYNHDHTTEIALEYFGHKITYQKLFQQVEIAKAAFENAGVKVGDQVAFFTSSTPEIIYGILALCRIGAVANMVNPLFDPEQVRDRIKETGTKLIVVMDQLYDKLHEVLEQDGGIPTIEKVIVVPVVASMPWGTRWLAAVKTKRVMPYGKTTISWADFVSEKKPEAFLQPDAEYKRDRAFIMVYSSGSTGASKGIILTNDGICATISHYLSPDFPYKRGDRFLQMIPVWFSTGIVLSVLMPLCLGVSVILEPIFSEKSFAKDIAKYRPNMTLAATSLWLYAMKSRELRNQDLSFLKYPITGGELILGRVEAALNAFFKQHNCKAPLIKGYGMCELGSTISTDDLKHRKPDAAGFPILGVTVAAFDLDTGLEKPYNEPGELRVLSPAHMKGYFKNSTATKEFFWHDSSNQVWGRTGDIGYVDEDGFVHVLGRSTDIFTDRSGTTQYCFYIENVILQNPAIAQCEVVGLPKDGIEVPVAHLVLEENTTEEREKLFAAIHAACIEALVPECVPFGYCIWDSFPIKNNGKRDMEKIKARTDGLFMPI